MERDRYAPRRPNPATRVILVLLSRLLEWRSLLTVVPARHAHPLASSGLAASLAADLEAKFMGLLDGVLLAARAKRLMDLCWKVKTLASAADIATAAQPI
jgi:hypothetical protein